MRIALDARCVDNLRPTGVENYTKLLVNNLNKFDLKNQYFFLKNKYRLPEGLWFHLYLPFWLWFNKIDIFHSPITRLPYWLPKTIKTVLTVHDLTWEYHPEYYSKTEYQVLKQKTTKDILRAQVILAISETTKSDLIKFYQLPAERIIVSPLAISPQPAQKIDLRNKFNIDYDYLLFVGTIYPRKNIEIILRALSEINNLHLILIGQAGFDKDKIIKLANDLNLSQRVHHLGYLSDPEVGALYHQALCFVFASKYEGFGLPILEAFQNKIPVIASDIPIFKEIGGGACLFFPPNDARALVNQITKLQTNFDLKTKLIAAGLKQNIKYSINNLVQQTIAAYLCE